MQDTHGGFRRTMGSLLQGPHRTMQDVEATLRCVRIERYGTVEILFVLAICDACAGNVTKWWLQA